MLTQCNPRNHLGVSQREVSPPSANTAEANWLQTQVGKRGKEEKKKKKETQQSANRGKNTTDCISLVRWHSGQAEATILVLTTQFCFCQVVRTTRSNGVDEENSPQGREDG